MQQSSLLFYKFRYLFASIVTVAFLLLISAVVTAVGSNSVLDTKANPAANVADVNTIETPNVITAGASALTEKTQHALVATGTTLYEICRTITATTVRSGNLVAHGSADTVDGTWSGVRFVGRGVASSVMFTFHAPGKVIGSLSAGHTVSALIKPTDDEKAAPVISSETSDAVLASFNAAEQKEIVQWQSQQLVANQALNGAVVAGDPNHGGYPAKWDDGPQDSMLDSWGMYNRECVSYAAWKVYQTYGYMPYWGGVGNANQWVGDAIRAGIPTSSTPKMHSVAISMHGYYGHAMWVEAVSGSMIYVSQYNYDLHGHYSEMWVNGSSFTYLYFK